MLSKSEVAMRSVFLGFFYGYIFDNDADSAEFKIEAETIDEDFKAIKPPI